MNIRDEIKDILSDKELNVVSYRDDVGVSFVFTDKEGVIVFEGEYK